MSIFLSKTRNQIFFQSKKYLSKTQFQHFIESKLCNHLSENSDFKNVSYIFDTSTSLGSIYKKSNLFKTGKFDPFSIEILDNINDKMKNPKDIFDPNFSEEIRNFFSEKPQEYFHRLFWARNPRFLFEKSDLKILLDKEKINDIYKFVANCKLEDYNLCGISSDKEFAFVNLMLNEKVFSYLSEKDLFSLDSKTITEIHDRKCSGDIPKFSEINEDYRLIKFEKLEAENLGFIIDGGQLINECTNKYHMKYLYSPIYVSQVMENTQAMKLGLMKYDMVVGINFTSINGLDLDTVHHIIQMSLSKSGSLVLTVISSPDEAKLFENLAKFYRESKEAFDTAPKSDHPSDIARKNKRPLWRMAFHKKLKSL